jgi:diguanylate cyclase (GGDEF)-like protein/PAS domain S-box-containing protein
MTNWWNSLSIATKLNIPIQAVLILVLLFANTWIVNGIEDDSLNAAKKRVAVSADGVINGMNMLMVTGMISDPDNRLLYIKKMGASENLLELRIIRAKQVQDQFGIGLPEEQAMDNMDRLAIASKQTQYLLDKDKLTPTLRAVVPFIASTNFRGTNCLSCHNVAVGSVNGAASIVLDMTGDFKEIQHRKNLFVFGYIFLQILLCISIQWLLHKYMAPLVKLKLKMESVQAKGSVEQFVPIEVKKGDLDEISKLTLAFNQMSQAISESEESMRLATSIYLTNSDAILVTDENNRIVDVNPAFTQITGYTHDEVIGKNPRMFRSGRHDKEFYAHMWHMILNESRWQGEIWDKRKNGEIYPKLLHIHALRRTDGSVYRHIAQFSDITEKKQKEELIFWQANYDPLTGLPNRRLLNERLEHILLTGKRNNHYGALMFLDMDKFKVLNDTLGHEYGDMLLIEVAARLKSCVREMDTVVRLGGDEFVVLIESISEFSEDALFIVADVSEKIRKTLAAPYQLNQYEYLSSPSIGVYLFDCKKDSADELLKRADMAMYQAKESGRNAVRFFDPEMQASVEERSAMESNLRVAIPEQQFQLYYQIQVNNQRETIGAEALIRWKHPQHGMVSPSIFIPFAEGSPLIFEIGYWVLDAACQQIAAWSQSEQTRNLVLAVNISAQQFKQPAFVDEIANMIQKYGIDPSCLKLELTESVAVHDIDSIVTKMNALRKDLGVTLSLDDFGTGYSSLSYLKRLPLDQIKIDQSFVRDITTDASDAVMVKTIIDMAHNFGLNVIAEGVENEEQMVFLKQNGCLAYQGYLFGKPVPIEEFEKLIALNKGQKN